MQRNMGQGAAVGDYDRDGDLDVYLLAQAGHPNALFRNDEDPAGGRRFTEVGAVTGVADEGLGRMALFADPHGATAWLDLVVLNDADPEGRLSPFLTLRNDQDGTFTDVTDGSGFEPIGYLASGAAAVDVDGDRDLDLYVTVWTQELGGTAPGDEIVGTFPDTIASIATTVTSASRTSPSGAASAASPATRSPRSSPTSTATAIRTSTCRSTIGPTSTTRTATAVSATGPSRSA